MTFMKKHPFLMVDYHSSVKLQPSEQRQIKKWLAFASPVVEELLSKKIIRVKNLHSVQVSLLICGEARIKKLNHDFRHKDKVTDVLSFPSHEDLRKTQFTENNLFLGDLAICHQKVRQQAKQFNISYMDEFIHLFFHGLIHLMGYDHEISEEEERLMQLWEKLALDNFSKKKKGA
jgi:probable rRNA maturation factor